ncbi:MAG: hypothetical protein KDK41_09735 [Leptospiraceae bacterium]|nr:hypothetical protein [Leptospiraceae bacterium]
MKRIAFWNVLFFVIIFHSGRLPDLLAAQPEIQLSGISNSAHQFLQLGNHYEAITEFHRSIFKESRPENIFRLNWQIASTYRLTGNREKSLSTYAKTALAGQFQSSSTEYLAFQLDYLQVLSVDKPLPSYQLLRDIQSHPDILTNAELRNQLRFETAKWLFANGNHNSATTFLADPFSNVNLETRAKILRHGIQNFPTPDSAYNLMYAIIPGGVFFRYHQFARGALSFFTVGLLSAGAVISFSYGWVVTGALSAFFAARYYLDSFIQSANYLQERRLQNEKFFRDDLLSKTGGAYNFRSLAYVRFVSPGLQ